MKLRASMSTFAAFAALCGGFAACGPATKEPETGKAVGPPQKITCPEGKELKGTECVAVAPKEACPPGTHAGANGGCVAEETPAQASASASATAAPSAAPSAAPEAASPCPAGMAFVKGGSYKTAFMKVETTVQDVCLDITEVMTKDYEACVKAGKCNANFLEACTETTTWKKPGKEDHPMVCIDFNQAETYCKAQGKRLPTEDEWEWAARGGPEAHLYSWGNDPPADQACWSGKEARTGTCPVNAHPKSATPQGLLGMSGNVFEWASRKLDAKTEDRTGRGGSWRDGLPNLLQVGRPGSFKVTYRCGFLGVRCAAEPKK
jgi:hypothetical protein